MILTNDRRSRGKKYAIAGSILLLINHAVLANENPLSAFDAAMAHVEQGQWQQAQGLLSYQLELKPTHHRARLELAMVLMQLNEYEQAGSHLSYLLTVNELPDGVRFNIELMQQQISNVKANTKRPSLKQTAHDWSFGVGLATGDDSNVRFSFGDYFLEDDPYTDGTYIELNDGTVGFYATDGNVYTEDGDIVDADVLGINFGPRKQDTRYIEAKIRGEHTATFSNWSWHNVLQVQRSENEKFSGFDKTLSKFQTELSWQITEDAEFYAKYQHRRLSRGGQRLLTSHDITVGYNKLSHYGNFGIYAQQMQRVFSDRTTIRGNIPSFFEGFDNDTSTLGISWSKFFLDRRLLTKLTLEHKDNIASDDFNYKGLSSKLTSIYKVTNDWSFTAYFSYFVQEYDDSYDEFGSLTDTSYKFGGKLNHQLTPATEIYLGADRGFRDSEVYGDISSEKTNVKLGINLVF